MSDWTGGKMEWRQFACPACGLLDPVEVPGHVATAPFRTAPRTPEEPRCPLCGGLAYDPSDPIDRDVLKEALRHGRMPGARSGVWADMILAQVVGPLIGRCLAPITRFLARRLDGPRMKALRDLLED